MKSKRQKQEPFNVKRTRMKDSIIKCKEIIQNYTVLEHELKKNNYEIDVLVEKSDSNFKMKAITTGLTVQECDLLNNRVANFDIEQMRNMIKVYQERRYKETEHQMIGNGLNIQKAKKNYGSSRNTRAKTDFSPIKVQFVEISPTKSKKNYLKRSKIELQPYQQKKQQKQEEIESCLVAKSVNRLKTTVFGLKKNQSETNYKENSKLLLGKDGLLMLKTRKKTQSYFQPEQTSKQSKRKEYLYQKMQKLRVDSRMRFNPIYQKRIKSYTDFLWKIMLAHNIYINLDLRERLPFMVKLKAYVSYGNNCNMIKGLLRRRFWWNVVEEYSEDCLFVWSQLKLNKIYRRQQMHRGNLELVTQSDTFQFLPSYISKKRKVSKEEKIKQKMDYQYHKKILNFRDLRLLESRLLEPDSNDIPKHSNQSYQSRTKQLNQTVKEIKVIQNVFGFPSQTQSIQYGYYTISPIIHNHLQNNFNLGNKKALFYNLKQYYTKIKEDVFQYIPLTFHIRDGLIDPEYKRFVNYYQQRRNFINKMSLEVGNQKGRNIWIVKPGENSNRGTGIVVIDEIYELDRILKHTTTKKRNTLGSKEKEGTKKQGKTYIVQMYIDRPFLFNGRKFDIRHYMLITNLHGVTRAYWYDQGYIRTSSYQFSLQNFEPEIHLTNDAIQKQYFDYGKYQPYNKISYSELQNYFNTLKDKKYNFKAEILPIMKKIATDAVKSVYTKISPGQQMHNFQIFGLDFMIDRDFKPWLIEINTNPCLDCSCPLLDRIIPCMVEQSLKLSLDIIYPPPSHYPNSSKHQAPFISLENFKYQLIFDSLVDAQDIGLSLKDSTNIESQIGIIDDDQVFKDDGKEIKLEDFT